MSGCYDRVLDPLLADLGLLLLADPVLPAVAQRVAGEPIRGSWWAHPAGGRIFAAASALEAHPDVVVVKLVCRKVTFVHRRLWPALLGAAASGGPWQEGGDRALLARVRAEGVVRARGKDLEERLLVRSWTEHTAGGRHETVLEAWERWAAREGVVALPAPDARAVLEAAAARLGPSARLPWR